MQIQKTPETVDMMVEMFKDKLESIRQQSSDKNETTIETACDFIIEAYPFTLWEVLVSKTNIPSKYDLLLINSLTSAFRKQYDIRNPYYSKIIDVYKSRKVI